MWVSFVGFFLMRLQDWGGRRESTTIWSMLKKEGKLLWMKLPHFLQLPFQDLLSITVAVLKTNLFCVSFGPKALCNADPYTIKGIRFGDCSVWYSGGGGGGSARQETFQFHPLLKLLISFCSYSSDTFSTIQCSCLGQGTVETEAGARSISIGYLHLHFPRLLSNKQQTTWFFSACPHSPLKVFACAFPLCYQVFRGSIRGACVLSPTGGRLCSFPLVETWEKQTLQIPCRCPSSAALLVSMRKPTLP